MCNKDESLHILYPFLNFLMRFLNSETKDHPIHNKQFIEVQKIYAFTFMQQIFNVDYEDPSG